uniref:Uncharacterized protein n=1 Tax=Cannabis sativa TaxID=3483 RepID=A0A803PCL7_CANSA
MASSSSTKYPSDQETDVIPEFEEFGGLSLNVEEDEEEYDVRWCLVGRFLNAGVIDIHDLQHGFRTERTLQRIGNYIGKYIKFDENNFSGVWREYFKIRVTINLDQPLKHRMKIRRLDRSDWFWVNFKYEHAPTFCFICGVIGHTDRTFPKIFDTPEGEIVKPYGSFMRATVQRSNKLIRSQWLRSGRGGRFDHEEGSQGKVVGINGGGDAGVNLDGGATSAVNLAPEFEENNEGNFDVNMVNDGEDFDEDMTISELKRKRKNSVGPGNLGFTKNGISENCISERGEYGYKKHGWGGPGITGSPGIMSTLSWNCRGLGNPRAIQFLKDLVVQKKPKFIFLCETLCGKNILEKVRLSLGYERMFVVEAHGHSGGLALLWKNSEEGEIIDFSDTHINILTHVHNMPTWRLVGIYGDANKSQRENTWGLIRQLTHDTRWPCLFIGDLNNVTSQRDKHGGRPYPERLIQGFSKVLADCNLVDMELHGHPFTWERGRGTTNWTEVRHDRALASLSWINHFLTAKLFNLHASSSDHCPIFMDPIIRNVFTGVKHFRFENAWLREPYCLQLVRDCWHENTTLSIQSKIYKCGEILAAWGKEITCNFKHQISTCKADIRRLKGKNDVVSVEAHCKAEKDLFERSILEAKDLVVKGGRLLVGSGENISITSDPWLPDIGNPFITSFHPSICDKKVKCLLTMDGTKWEIEIINDLFNDRDKDLILSSPISPSNVVDTWYWSKENSGCYSVKSAYALLQELKSASVQSTNSGPWREIWSLKIPPKVKEMLWRTLSNCLPTRVQLIHRRVHIDLACPRCNREAETSAHCIVGCNFAAACWRFAVTNTDLVLDGYFEMLKAMLFKLDRVHGMVVWITEALGVKEVLSWIKNSNFSNITVETDSLVTVQALRSSVIMGSPFGSCIEECKGLRSSLNNVNFRFVKRSANRVTHAFARALWLFADRSYSGSSIPSNILDVIVQEML